MLIINGQPANLDQHEFANFHGTSVFTTMRALKQEILNFESHWQRLKNHASYFGFALPEKELLEEIIKHELAKITCDQKIRIIIGAKHWALSLENADIIDPRIYDGVEICISKYQPHPQLGKYKTSNSLPYILAAQEAKSQGVFEALLLDYQGYICDGSRTSIMLYDGKNLNSLQGGLDGCMRQEALSYAQSLGVNIKNIYIKPEEICGQLLLSNSLIGIVPVGLVKTKLVQNLVEFFRMDKRVR